MIRIVSLQSLAAVLVSALALGSVACAPQEDDAGAAPSSVSGELTAPAPEPVVIKCVTNTGEHEVTEEQCKKLLTIAGCKPGAVVGDKMKCSTTSTDPSADVRPDDLAAPAPEPVVIKCVTNTGEHEVTEEQCKKLLTIAGCKPGAVVGDKMKCSTTSTDPSADVRPDDFAAPAPEPVVIKCVTNTGEHEVTEEQCKKLLTIAGCKPGAVVGDKMKCSTT